MDSHKHYIEELKKQDREPTNAELKLLGQMMIADWKFKIKNKLKKLLWWR